ncbi:MAG: sigma factor [Verrucomicrobiales bacterium]
MLSSPLPTYPVSPAIFILPLIAAPQPSDETAALIAGVRQGDERRRAHWLSGWSTAGRADRECLPALRGEFEDVVQDIFLRLFRRLRHLSRRGSARTLAARAARFACIDRLRRLRSGANAAGLTSPRRRAFAEAADPGGGRSDAAPEDALALIDRLLATLR